MPAKWWTNVSDPYSKAGYRKNSLDILAIFIIVFIGSLYYNLC